MLNFTQGSNIGVNDNFTYNGIIGALQETAVQTFDSTGSLEITLSTAIFNSKLGAYDSSSCTFANDSLTLSAAEFVANIASASQIPTVGKLSTLYSDFTAYVKNYFNISGSGPMEGFSTLFAGDFNFNPNSSVFSPTDFYNLINRNVSLITDSSYINALSGVVDLSNINQVLRNAVSANPFMNRDPSSNPGVSDGFVAGDLIFVPFNGISITMNLVVEPETFPTPLNNYNVNVTGGATQDASFTTNPTVSNSSNGTSWTNSSLFIQNTNASTILITRVVTAPLLLVMS